MKANDLVKFSEIMMALAEVFESDGEPSAVKIEIYFNALKDKTIKQITEAAGKLFRNRAFSSFPKPAELITLIDGPESVKALAAWGLVMKCLENGDIPPDPAINETVRRIGGWDWLSTQGYTELHWIEKRFIEHFEAINDGGIPLLEDKRVVALAEVACGGKLSLA